MMGLQLWQALVDHENLYSRSLDRPLRTIPFPPDRQRALPFDYNPSSIYFHWLDDANSRGISF